MPGMRDVGLPQVIPRNSSTSSTEIKQNKYIFAGFRRMVHSGKYANHLQICIFLISEHPGDMQLLTIRPHCIDMVSFAYRIIVEILQERGIVLLGACA